MKKLMIGLVGALSIAATAQAEVASENIVGYSTKEIKANTFYMIATQFQKTGATEVEKGKNSLNDLISMSGIEAVASMDGDDFTDFEQTAAQIQVMDTDGGYKLFYYINDAWDEKDEPLTGNYWADSLGYAIPDDDEVLTGKGFWFKAPTIQEGATITVNGEVIAADQYSIDFDANSFRIVANPYPNSVKVMDMNIVGVEAKASMDGDEFTDFEQTAAQIQVMDSDNGYKLFYFICDAWNQYDEPLDGNYWADSLGYVTDDVIPVGQSFWIKSPTAGSLKFNR